MKFCYFSVKVPLAKMANFLSQVKYEQPKRSSRARRFSLSDQWIPSWGQITKNARAPKSQFCFC